MEQQNKRRTHLKLGVYCVLAVSCAGLMAMLIQGCKKPAEDTTAQADNTSTNNNTSTPDAAATSTNTNPTSLGPVAMTSSNAQPGSLPVQPAQPVVAQPVIAQPVVPTEPPVAVMGDYTVVKGDSLAKIAKKVGVTRKALQAANPTVQPTKLKIGQKLVVPAGGKTTADATAPGVAPVAEAGGETYTVKSGDTLTKIAKANGVKVKALQTLNGLTTTQIKVGQKLKIPAKAEAPAAPATAPAAPTDATVAPAASTMPAVPAPTLAPAPAATTPTAPAHN
jgi:LysM repeat protein